MSGSCRAGSARRAGWGPGGPAGRGAPTKLIRP